MNTESSENTMYGILAEFRNPKELLDAAKAVSDSGYRNYDTFSPFPIHGMEAAMRLKKSKVGWIVLGHGILGFLGAFTMIWFMMVHNYQLNISGKALMNVPAWVPIMFELTVLLSAFGAMFGMFFLNGLPRLNHPLYNSDNFKRATDDGFFVCIEATDPQFEESKVQKLLADAGATNIEKIYGE